jgi:hypothetical protein
VVVVGVVEVAAVAAVVQQAAPFLKRVP